MRYFMLWLGVVVLALLLGRVHLDGTVGWVELVQRVPGAFNFVRGPK